MPFPRQGRSPDAILADLQTYKRDDLPWEGGRVFAYIYAVINPGVTSSKSGGPIAACWAILNHLGREGYLKLVNAAQQASRKIVDAVQAIEGLEIMGRGQTNMLALRATDFNIFPLADEMKRRGWYIQPQFGYANSAENMHLSVGYHNVPQVEAFVEDLAQATALVRAAQRGRERFVLPAELRELLVDSGPKVLDQVGDLLGGDGHTLPAQMEQINAILNQLPAATREKLLGEFVNRLYNPDPA